MLVLSMASGKARQDARHAQVGGHQRVGQPLPQGAQVARSCSPGPAAAPERPASPAPAAARRSGPTAATLRPARRGTLPPGPGVGQGDHRGRHVARGLQEMARQRRPPWGRSRTAVGCTGGASSPSLGPRLTSVGCTVGRKAASLEARLFSPRGLYGEGLGGASPCPRDRQTASPSGPSTSTTGTQKCIPGRIRRPSRPAERGRPAAPTQPETAAIQASPAHRQRLAAAWKRA